MKNTIIMITILIGQSLGLTAQTIQYQYDSNGNRTQQKTTSCPETPTTPQTQRVILDKGWNLISTYIQPTAYAIEKIFSNSLSDVLKIKSQTDSYDPTIANDFNTLKAIEDGAGYLVNMKRSTIVAITGNYNPNHNTKITLKKGWNLIGYPYAQTQGVERAFLSIQPIVEKVKSDFESYDPTIAPAFNTLSQLEAGKGYWVKVTEATDFVYPKPIGTGRSNQAKYVAQRNQQQEDINWQPLSYPTSMIAYGQVTLDGLPITGKAMIGAFIGQECRATALVQPNETQTVSSLVINGLQEEVIQFYLYQNGQIYPTAFTTTLKIGQTPDDLLPLAFTTKKAVANQAKKEVFVSPNPFATTLHIQLDLPENAITSLHIYNATGQKIIAKSLGQLEKGLHNTVWDLQAYQRQLTRGIYFLEVKTPTKIYTKKIIYTPLY